MFAFVFSSSVPIVGEDSVPGSEPQYSNGTSSNALTSITSSGIPHFGPTPSDTFIIRDCSPFLSTTTSTCAIFITPCHTYLMRIEGTKTPPEFLHFSLSLRRPRLRNIRVGGVSDRVHGTDPIRVLRSGCKA